MNSFLNYSKRIGSNFLLSQGPGGNTSTKYKGNIYIKKSGMYLEGSQNKNIFEKVNLENIRDFYKKNKSDLKYSNSLSIESPIHVLLDDKHIFHYHSISSIIISLIIEKKTLNKYLKNENITAIKYLRPGYSLGAEIINKTSKRKINSFFLYNHGMIVAGNSLEKIYLRINEIEYLFKKFIDFKILNKLIKEIEILDSTKDKTILIKNPKKNLNYEKFNNKYFFPDHAVFLPYHFINKDKWDKKNKECIIFDKEYIYINFPMDKAQKIYLKTLLIICVYIDSNKIINFISELDGLSLRESEDEILRIQLNK